MMGVNTTPSARVCAWVAYVLTGELAWPSDRAEQIDTVLDEVGDDSDEWWAMSEAERVVLTTEEGFTLARRWVARAIAETMKD